MIEKIDNESLVVVILGVIVVVAMVTMGAEAKDVVIAVGAGLIGYLKGRIGGSGG